MVCTVTDPSLWPPMRLVPREANAAAVVGDGYSTVPSASTTESKFDEP